MSFVMFSLNRTYMLIVFFYHNNVGMNYCYFGSMSVTKLY